MGPAQASSVSALTNTGTLLSNVLAIALFGGVYLSSPTTLTHVTVPLAALIVLAAAVARNR